MRIRRNPTANAEARSTWSSTARDSRCCSCAKESKYPKLKLYRGKAGPFSKQILQFIDSSAELLKVTRSWKLHQTDGELCAVVEGLRAFAAMDDWRTVIDLIPDQLMNPSSRDSLVSMLRKGARYRHAARILYRTAKKHPVARRMEALAVHLDASAFHVPLLSSPPTSLDATLSRVLSGQNHNIAPLCRALKTTAAHARTTFDTQTRQTLTEGKVHAEVQLLCYILQNPSPSPPRIVCASKDACFLCHCLLQAHGKLLSPRCHGRLYPGWRMPPTPALRPLQTSLNHMLEQKIRDGAAALWKHNGARRRGLPMPCESSCSTAVLSTTTVVGDEAPPSTQIITATEKTPSEPAVDETFVSSHTLVSASDMVPTREVEVQPVESRDTLPQREDWSVGEIYALAQGEAVTSSLPTGRLSRMYTAEQLQVQLEYTTEQQEMGGETPHLEYQIQQLTPCEGRALRESSYTSIIDVSLMAVDEQRNFQLNELAELYLSAGDCIFRLTLQPAQPS